jgi:predicted transcriptional regulator of viral defense system
MPKTLVPTLYEMAEPRHGYFTTADARAAGILPQTIVKMERRGVVERISRGVYRLAQFPLFRHGQYMEAVLWPEAGERGVLSHESALAFHELSDVSPSRVHITLRPRRLRREVPPHLVIHHAELPAEDVQVLDGIPVTTPVRTIRDCHAAGLGDRLVRQAVADGLDNGKLTSRQADQLRTGLLGGEEQRP